MNQEQFAKTANAGDEQVAALKEKLKMATDALAMIAKYAPTRPAAFGIQNRQHAGRAAPSFRGQLPIAHVRRKQPDAVGANGFAGDS